MPSFAPPYLRQNATMRASASSFSSDHIPRSFLLSRPGISTAVASVMSSAAPDTDRWPRCIMCQSVAQPLSAEYCPIGDTTMRLPSSNPRILNLEKRTDDILPLGSSDHMRHFTKSQFLLRDSRIESPTMAKHSLDERRDLDNNRICICQVRHRRLFTTYLEILAVIIPSSDNVWGSNAGLNGTRDRGGP